MVTKEEILQSKIGFQGGVDDKWYLQASATHYLDTGKPSGSFHNALTEAMEEWAKAQTIGFDKWKHEKGWMYNEGYYYQPNESTPFLTGEQLYELFLQSQNKQ